MTNTIKHICENCGRPNVIDVSELRGMPLKNTVGEVVKRPPVNITDGALILNCEHCNRVMVYDCAKNNSR